MSDTAKSTGNTPDRYAVMGNPVAHSLSPRIHARFAQQTGQHLDYEAILVEPDGFPTAVEAFQRAGGKGLNVTVPFKEDAWRLADARSPRAERAGAVNTLVLRADGSRYGDNTDGVGLVRDLLDNQGASVRARRVLLLGAGGAARGVLEPLLEQRPARLVIANRTPDKAKTLAAAFRDLGPVEGGGFPELEGHAFDLVINATAAGLAGQVPPVPPGVVTLATWCYDMMYGKGETDFVRWARRQGTAHAVDGLGMLVEQAAESFLLWRGVRPDTAPVIKTLRAELRKN